MMSDEEKKENYLLKKKPLNGSSIRFIFFSLGEIQYFSCLNSNKIPLLSEAFQPSIFPVRGPILTIFNSQLTHPVRRFHETFQTLLMKCSLSHFLAETPTFCISPIDVRPFSFVSRFQHCSFSSILHRLCSFYENLLRMLWCYMFDMIPWCCFQVDFWHRLVFCLAAELGVLFSVLFPPTGEQFTISNSLNCCAAQAIETI